MTVERITPRNRRAWLKARKADVTASVVASLFDAHPWVSRWALWMLKAGRIDEDPTESPAMQRGRLLEPVAVQLIREQNPGWSVHHNAANEYLRDPEARLGATPDVMVECPQRGPGIIQVKTVEASAYRRNWLVDGEPEAPLWIALQATLEAHLAGARWAAVAPLTVGHGIDCPVIGVDLRPGVVNAIYARVAEFWASVEAGDEPPLEPERDGPLLDRMHPYGDPEHEIDMSLDNRVPILLAERQHWSVQRRVAGEKIDAIDAEIKSKMGDAHVAWIGHGRKITWMPQHRASYSVPARTLRVMRYPGDCE